MNLLPYFLIWSGLAMFVLGLALYRRLVSMHEDEFLHLGAGGEKLIPDQVAVYEKLGGVDRWGKRLTAITLGLGALLLVAYLYKVLQAGLAYGTPWVTRPNRLGAEAWLREFAPAGFTRMRSI